MTCASKERCRSAYSVRPYDAVEHRSCGGLRARLVAARGGEFSREPLLVEAGTDLGQWPVNLSRLLWATLAKAPPRD